MSVEDEEKQTKNLIFSLNLTSRVVVCLKSASQIALYILTLPIRVKDLEKTPVKWREFFMFRLSN